MFFDCSPAGKEKSSAEILSFEEVKQGPSIDFFHIRIGDYGYFAKGKVSLLGLWVSQKEALVL
jgi:hypothetical protein